MAKETIRENIVEEEGVRAYEIDGMRVTMPADWDDDKKLAWLNKAKDKSHLRRNLRMIKKNGSTQLLNAYRLNGDD